VKSELEQGKQAVIGENEKIPKKFVKGAESGLKYYLETFLNHFDCK